MKIRAYAKINLTLDILGKRPDGYHELDMIMQTVDLYDDIEISLNNSGKITVNSTNAELGGENDITYKAAKLFLEKVSSNSGVDIKIDKHIPIAAGLGGGSSDAAAVVVALNKLLNTNLDKKDLESICLKLGADVPYFLYGGTVAVSGMGEIFKPLESLPKCFIVIAKDGKKASTGELYRKIDSIECLDSPDNKKAHKLLENKDLQGFCKEMKNVFSVLWHMEYLEKIMKENGALCSLISGSGPSYFGIFETEKQAKNTVNVLKSKNTEAYFTQPVSCPQIITE